ncbi:MAG: glycosyltransferase family 4 protein [Elainella sp. Prado103]|nr:glycosyltransferase family 4 protein [Elainella sp. Prado103]
MQKLAIITSHPIQYYAPWFCYLATRKNLDIKVFYLWDFGATRQIDPKFQTSFQWDIPLLTGYNYEFVPNTSSNPGTHHFWGLQNPSLIARVKDYQPDAVWLMNYNYASLYRLISSWDTSKAPLLFRGDSHHLLPQTGLKEQLRRHMIAMIYRRFAAFLYVGKANYGYFRYHQVPPEKLFFSPHAIDNDRFLAQAEMATQQAQTWKQELGIPTNHPVILFAGKFEPKKRPLDLLHAFLQAQLSQVSLLFVGSGSLEAELKADATGHPHIYFAPFQNQSSMPRTYAIADIVVLPSYGSQETWGLSINEAMCLGRPVIVSDHVGCAQDLVQPDKNGLVFPAGNVSALADALRDALSEPERLRRWGEQSRCLISHYDYARATQGLFEALNSL